MNHLAAKIIENVCTTLSCYAQGFITGEIGPVLWYLFTHSTVDSLKITAISVRNVLSLYRNVSCFTLKIFCSETVLVFLSMFSVCVLHIILKCTYKQLKSTHIAVQFDYVFLTLSWCKNRPI